MFSFKDLSKTTEYEEEVFKSEEYLVSCEVFLETRRNSKQSYVFDLRTAEEYEVSHLPGSHSLPFEHFENAIYQMPYQGDILLYGAGNDEALKAAEILYENGFDTFSFIHDYAELLTYLKEASWKITPEAKAELESKLGASSEFVAARFKAVAISPKRASYKIEWVSAEGECAKQDGDVELEQEGLPIVIDGESLLYLQGSIVKWDTEAQQFVVKNETFEVPPLQGDAKERVQQLIDDEINPSLASHGGFVNMVKIEDATLFLEFGGGCQGCGSASATLKHGVEVVIKENVPGIVKIADITDHASGENPYFS